MKIDFGLPMDAKKDDVDVLFFYRETQVYSNGINSTKNLVILNLTMAIQYVFGLFLAETYMVFILESSHPNPIEFPIFSKDVLRESAFKLTHFCSGLAFALLFYQLSLVF